MKSQTLTFARADGWTPTSVREWLVQHGYDASNRLMTIDHRFIRVRQTRKNGERPWLDLSLVLAAIPAMEDAGVSAVARSPRGFVSAYRKARGAPDRLGMDSHSGQSWRARRNAFVARHLAQMQNEPRWVEGQPTRRHLALIAWAYSPDAAKVRRWLTASGARR